MKHLLKFSLCALALTMGANTGFAQSGETGLKDAYKDYFSIGVAVNMRNISNPEQIAIIKKDFNSITAENDMKPQPTEPAYGQFNWENADKIANFCRSNGIKLRGHCLMWHAQIGEWMYQDEKGNLVSKEKLFQNMKHHITAIVERYKDVIYAWDVVNEAISDGGWQGGRRGMGEHPSPYRNSPLYQIAGDEFIKKAFIYAREADPDVLLFYLTDVASVTAEVELSSHLLIGTNIQLSNMDMFHYRRIFCQGSVHIFHTRTVDIVMSLHADTINGH